MQYNIYIFQLFKGLEDRHIAPPFNCTSGMKISVSSISKTRTTSWKEKNGDQFLSLGQENTISSSSFNSRSPKASAARVGIFVRLHFTVRTCRRRSRSTHRLHHPVAADLRRAPGQVPVPVLPRPEFMAENFLKAKRTGQDESSTQACEIILLWYIVVYVWI